MRYLVTGGAGFIGSAISQKLIDKGHEVYIIDNLTTGFIHNIPKKAIFIKGDFSQDQTILELEEIRFDCIFHIGGQSSGEISFEQPEYDLNTNTLSTLKLLKYAQRTSCKKFIYASTMSVYGENKRKEKFCEKDETNPKSFYAVGKLATERYLDIYSREYDIEFVALRYFNVYGPGQNLENLKQGMVSIYLKQFLDESFEKVIVKGDLNRFRDLIYIDDVVNITIRSAEDKNFSNKIINVATGKKTTVKEILNLIVHYTNSKKVIEIGEGTPGDQFGIFADNTSLKKLYKEPLVSFEVGLKNMITWIRDNN